MTFPELEKICSLLWGQSWQSELARHLKIDRRTVSVWRTRSVPKWVNNELPDLLELRQNQISEAIKLWSFE